MSEDFDFAKLEAEIESGSLTLGMSGDEIFKTFYTILHVASTVGQAQTIWEYMVSEVGGLATYETTASLPRDREDPAWDSMVDVIGECIPFGTRWLIAWMKMHHVPYVSTWMPMHGEWLYITFGNIDRIKQDFDLPDL